MQSLSDRFKKNPLTAYLEHRGITDPATYTLNAAAGVDTTPRADMVPLTPISNILKKEDALRP